MKAKITNQVVLPHAWIVNSTDQGRKSIKKGNLVYLQDNSEFKIELFNPLKENVLAVIKVNSNLISKNGLVIRPGERFYLDCFLDDKKKFLFKTYNVENTEESKEAIKNNGLIEVSFYKEEIIQLNNWNNWDNWNWDNWYSKNWNYNGTVTFNSDNCNNTTIGGGTYNSHINNLCNNTTNTTFGNRNPNLRSKSIINPVDNYLSLSSDIETGRIEKGEKSSQKFVEVDMKFQTFAISNVKYQLLPESQKPIETSNLKSKNVDFYEVLKKLADLHNSGILTDDEYQTKKKEILNKI